MRHSIHMEWPSDDAIHLIYPSPLTQSPSAFALKEAEAASAEATAAYRRLEQSVACSPKEMQASSAADDPDCP